MAAITDLSDLINRSSGGANGNPEAIQFFKAARQGGAAATVLIAGRPASLWRYDGTWSAGDVPGAAAVPTRTTPGALRFTNPSGGREKHLIQAYQVGLNAGTLVLYDRVLHCGGLSATVTTAQTVGGTLTRNTGGVGNFAFLEINTLIGATATTVRMSYTNQDGTAGRLSTLVQLGGTGFREVSRAIMLPLQSGDTGIRSVQSVTLTGTTAIAGNFGLVVANPLAWVSSASIGVAGVRDFAVGLPNIPTIDADACIAPLWLGNTTAAPEFFGGIATVEA